MATSSSSSLPQTECPYLGKGPGCLKTGFADSAPYFGHAAVRLRHFSNMKYENLKNSLGLPPPNIHCLGHTSLMLNLKLTPQRRIRLNFY